MSNFYIEIVYQELLKIHGIIKYLLIYIITT